jgi:predicted short-subunit dehydrogenase-like oxidoreductase (DUF2520 family)
MTLVLAVAARNTNSATVSKTSMGKDIGSISIIGSGNVAYHLGKAFAGHVKINSIYSRNKNTAIELAEDLHAFHAAEIKDLIPSDLVLICVNDDQVELVLNQIPADQAVAYSSGSVGLAELSSRENLGVVYPLQTFSKSRQIDLFEVPFFIEATNEVFAQKLFDLAWLLSRKVIFANSEDRKNLHLAGVMVNNFVNHIVFLAEEFLKKNSMEWKYLKPLIKETAMKLQSIDPYDAQTGPAVRGDQKTIDRHLEMLDSDNRALYELITKSIQKHHKIQ